MRAFVRVIAGLCCLSGAVSAQNYQTQYPYDPYSGSPQPQPAQPPTTGYQGYSAPTYSDKGGYSYGQNESSEYARLLTWGQLEAHYAYNDFTGDDKLKGDSGFGVNLRVKLMKPLYLHFGLDRITSSAPHASSLEMTNFTVGAGAYLPIGQRFQLYGEVGARYDYVSGHVDSFSADDFLVYLRPGIRFAVTDKLELTASVLLNTDNFNDRVIEVSAYYALLSWLDVGGGIDFGSDVNTYRIGGRWRWD